MSNVLSKPAVLIGLIALVDLVAQKRPVAGCIKGTVKTIMGFVVLGAGAGLVVSSLGDLANIFQYASGIRDVVPDNEAIVSVVQKSFGKEMTMIAFFAMVINIMIARFILRKFIPLIGHYTLSISTTVAVILAIAGITSITPITVGSLVAGMAMVFFPAIARSYMKKATGPDNVAIGHLSALSYVLTGFIGSRFGSEEHSTKDMNVPKSLLSLYDTLVTISFTMSIILLVMCLFAGADMVKELNGGKN